MLVAVPEDVATACETILAPLVLVRVAGAEQALEQLPVDQPLLVCTMPDVDIGRATRLRERASDVGAVLVVIPRDSSAQELDKLLRRALIEAEG
jgi:hypothetical protein